MSDGFEFKTDDEGTVTISVSAKGWKRFLKYAGQMLHLDVCAHAAYKADRYTASASFWRYSSNCAQGRIYYMIPDDLRGFFEVAKVESNEPGK